MRLAVIARDYIDGRRGQNERVSQPDSRASLEKLSEVAAQCHQALAELPASLQQFYDCGIEDLSPAPLGSELPSELGTAFLELADYDALVWLPDTPPELGPALSRLRCLLQELGSRCAALPMQSEWALIKTELNNSVACTIDTCSLATVLQGLHTNSSMAADFMKSARGPRSDTLRMRAVLRLQEEFARQGLPTTHNPNGATGYVGIGSSPFDRFVQLFFAEIEPDDTQQHGLNDAVAFACRPGRMAKAAGPD